MAVLNCPKCGKENDAAMAFCIFCGEGMKAANVTDSTISVAQAAAQAAPTASVESMAQTQGVPFLCPSCNKSDPLNGKFCVICGADIAAVLVSRAKVLSDPSLPMQAMPRVRKPGEGSPARAISILLALIAGGGLGVAAGQYFHQKPEPPKRPAEFLPKPYPAFSKVVLSSRPGASSKNSEQRYIFGITDKDGKFEYNSLKPGTYDVMVDQDSGSVTVDEGKTPVVSIGSH